jgi:hypothetical protein
MTLHTAPPTTADRRNARQDARAAARQAANDAALAAAIAAGYPELDGTPAQVAWAVTIRHNVLQAMQDRLTAAIAADPALAGDILSTIDAMAAETSASWWINNGRGITVYQPDGGTYSVSTVDVTLMYARQRAGRGDA